MILSRLSPLYIYIYTKSMNATTERRIKHQFREQNVCDVQNCAALFHMHPTCPAYLITNKATTKQCYMVLLTKHVVESNFNLTWINSTQSAINVCNLNISSGSLHVFKRYDKNNMLNKRHRKEFNNVRLANVHETTQSTINVCNFNESYGWRQL